MYSDIETVENLNNLEDIINIISPTLILSFLVALIITCIGIMLVFKKAGKKWYESLVPGHSLYAMFEIAGMSGANFFLLYVPIVNIIIVFKLYIKLAKAFGKGAGFGLGLLFFPTLFFLILGIDRSQHFSKSQEAPVEPLHNEQNKVEQNKFVPNAPEPINNVGTVFDKKINEAPPQPVATENVSVNKGGVDAPPVVNAPISAAGPLPAPPVIDAPVVTPVQPPEGPTPPPQPKNSFIEPPQQPVSNTTPNNKIDPFNINNKS